MNVLDILAEDVRIGFRGGEGPFSNRFSPCLKLDGTISTKKNSWGLKSIIP